MERRTDDELREHPVFRQLVKDMKDLPQERQERLIEEMEKAVEDHKEDFGDTENGS